MPSQVQNNGACKKFIEIALSSGERKHVDMYIAMNTTSNKTRIKYSINLTQGLIEALLTMSVLWKEIKVYKGEINCEAIVIAAESLGRLQVSPSRQVFPLCRLFPPTNFFPSPWMS